MRLDAGRVLIEPFASEIEGKVVAVGDIHGDFDQIRQLLDHLGEDGLLDDRWIVFLGDYLDIGPDSSRVIERLLLLHEAVPRSTFLCGNHDLNLAKSLGVVDSPHQGFYWNRLPLRNAETLESYGATDGWDLRQKMPDSHKGFLGRLPWVVEHPDYLFVHCGFDSDVSLEDQLRHLRQRDTRLWKPRWLRRTRPSDTQDGHRRAHHLAESEGNREQGADRYRGGVRRRPDGVAPARVRGHPGRGTK